MSNAGNGNYSMEEEEQLMFSAITFFGALTIFLSLTVCGKRRGPFNPTTAAAKQKSSKNVKETEKSQKSKKKKSSLKTENSKKTQNETTLDKSESPSAMGKPITVGNDSKQQQKSMKTISKTQEPSEHVTQETLQVSTTQASSGTNEIRSAKECAVATPLDKNKNVAKVDGKTPMKESGAKVSTRERAPTSNLSTARPQQLQQPSTLLEDFSQKQSQNEKSEDQEEVLPPRVYAPASPRNVERDRELAAKALKNIRARRAQNVYSARERAQPSPQKDEQEAPEENPEENASNPSNDEKAAAGGGNGKKKSVSSDFPTVDKPDIIAEGEKIVGVDEIEKANKENTGDVDDNKDKEDDEEVESKKESKKKKIKVQHGVYVPPEKRQFKSVKDIPADDITIKRAIKKKHKKKKDKKKEKKHKKKKSKKRSDSSSDEK